MPSAPRFAGAVLSFSAATTQRSSILAAAAPTSIDALIFDCDGVIVESEDIHRRAYNAAFEEFDVRCPADTSSPVVWSVEFYDMLQNKVGGGKPKMRWYFGENKWPTSSVLGGKTAETEDEKTLLIDTLQDWKTEKYKAIIGSEVEPRPGILKLMDDARASGTPVAVCSASTKAAVSFTLPALLGKERFDSLDLFIAGDDVPLKKPDPMIYKVAAERLGVDPARCLVIEDSMIGLAAALGAGMRCVITYHSGTESQDFPGASAVLANMDGMEFAALAGGKIEGRDDRKVSAGAK